MFVSLVFVVYQNKCVIPSWLPLESNWTLKNTLLSLDISVFSCTFSKFTLFEIKHVSSSPSIIVPPHLSGIILSQNWGRNLQDPHVKWISWDLSNNGRGDRDKRECWAHPLTHRKHPKDVFPWLKFVPLLNKFGSGIWHPKQVMIQSFYP